MNHNPFRRSLYSTLELIGRHVRGFWPAVIVFFALGALLGTIITAALVAAARVVEAQPVRRFDEAALHWFAARRGPLMDRVMLQFTTLGDGTVVLMIALVAAVFLWLTRHRWSAGILLGAVAGGQALSNLLKLAFGRPRPDVIEWLTHTSSPSFPSGHAMAALLTYGSVALLAGRLAPNRGTRAAIGAVAALLIIGIGTSRVHLGVHYPTDVIGGYVAGGGWLAFVVASVVAVRHFAPRRPATRTEERGLGDRG